MSVRELEIQQIVLALRYVIKNILFLSVLYVSVFKILSKIFYSWACMTWILKQSRAQLYYKQLHLQPISWGKTKLSKKTTTTSVISSVNYTISQLTVFAVSMAYERRVFLKIINIFVSIKCVESALLYPQYTVIQVGSMKIIYPNN